MINARKEFTDFVAQTCNTTVSELESTYNIVGDAIWDHLRRIKCVKIGWKNWNWEEDSSIGSTRKEYRTYEQVLLKAGYSHKEFIHFLEELDFEYDNGYGIQQLTGTIWFQDGESSNHNASAIDIIGTWATRGEHNGSEWWVYHRCPNLQCDIVPRDGARLDYKVINFEEKGLRNARFVESLNKYIEIE